MSVGNNLPPADTDPPIARLGELTAQLSENYHIDRICKAEIAWAKVPVDDDDKAAKVGDIIHVARVAFNAIDRERTNQKKPFLTASRKVDEHFAPFLKAIKGAKEALQGYLDAYMTRKDEIAAEERRRLEERAKQKQAEADIRAAEARTVQEQKDADKAKREATALQAKARATTGHVHTDYGATIHVHKTWTFEIDDFAQVPDKYKIIDHVGVNTAIKGDRGLRDIPGLRIFQKTKSGTR